MTPDMKKRVDCYPFFLGEKARMRDRPVLRLSLVSLRLRPFALKCFGVAQTNFDCKLSIMTITSPSTTKGK